MIDRCTSHAGSHWVHAGPFKLGKDCGWLRVCNSARRSHSVFACTCQMWLHVTFVSRQVYQTTLWCRTGSHFSVPLALANDWVLSRLTCQCLTHYSHQLTMTIPGDRIHWPVGFCFLGELDSFVISESIPQRIRWLFWDEEAAYFDWFPWGSPLSSQLSIRRSWKGPPARDRKPPNIDHDLEQQLRRAICDMCFWIN